MHKSLATIGSALSALPGVTPDQPAAMSDANTAARIALDADHTVVLHLPLNTGIHNMYATHSSHSSHASHSSHYSGSGGSSPSPASTAPAAPASSEPTSSPSSPATTGSPASTLSAPQTATRPSADQLQLMIMRVQAALYSKGYDPGAIDGTLSVPTKAAIRKYQAAHGLAASGTLTTETMNSLGISLAR